MAGVGRIDLLETFGGGGMRAEVTEIGAALRAGGLERFKNAREVRGIDAGGAEEIDGEGVGLAFEFPRIAELQEEKGQRGGEARERGEIAGEGADEDERGAVAQHALEAVAFFDVTEFVRKHGGQLLVIGGEVVEFVGDDEDAAGQGEGVGCAHLEKME